MEHDPVRDERLATVEGERLLPVSRRLRDLCPKEPDADLASVDDVRAVELTDSVAKAAENGWVEVAAAGGRRPPDTPDLFLGVEQPKGVPLEAGAARELRSVEVLDVAEAAEDRIRLGLRLELRPGLRFSEGVVETTVVDAPASEEEIEVVRGCGWRFLDCPSNPRLCGSP
jgi:hypothetical protein